MTASKVRTVNPVLTRQDVVDTGQEIDSPAFLTDWLDEHPDFPLNPSTTFFGQPVGDPRV